MKQSQITDTAQKPEKPTPPKPAAPPNKQPEKQMPTDIKILTEAIEEIEEILWAARNKLYQQYAPIDYTTTAPIASKFTPEQEENLTFESNGEFWIIKPKGFLQKEMFTDIAQRVKTLGGEYISAGPNTHPYFKVRKA